jgi:hypothetical protein
MDVSGNEEFELWVVGKPIMLGAGVSVAGISGIARDWQLEGVFQ